MRCKPKCESHGGRASYAGPCQDCEDEMTQEMKHTEEIQHPTPPTPVPPCPSSEGRHYFSTASMPSCERCGYTLPQLPQSLTPDVEAIKARLEKASPGPWRRVEEYADEPFDYVIEEDPAKDRSRGGYCIIAQTMIKDGSGAHPQERADADFIAHARQDIPALLSERERLIGEVAEQLEDIAELMRQNLLMEERALKAEAEVGDITCSLGVGTGDTGLFVYGSYEAIKACQARLLETAEMQVDLENARAALRLEHSRALFAEESLKVARECFERFRAQIRELLK